MSVNGKDGADPLERKEEGGRGLGRALKIAGIHLAPGVEAAQTEP